MEKIDFKKQFKDFYGIGAGKMKIVDVPEMQFLTIDGKGDPNNSQSFQAAIECLYSVSYTLKFMVKKGELGIDYGVMPLEGQWYMEDNSQFSMERKQDWFWTIMIMQPDFITGQMVQDAIKAAGAKKDIEALPLLKITDGLAAQVLYTGPYSEEGPTILKLHEFIKEQGYELTGRHREIYLSDMRRTAPEKLKTIIRQPIKKS